MENSKIEWVATVNPDGTVSPGHTFNPVIGCMKVSDGCKHCYAEALMDKRYNRAQWGPNTRRIRTSSSNWKKPLQWNANAKASGQRAKVFCASLSDVFEDHPDWVQPRADLFSLIAETPHLDWLLLTKRPENINRMVADYAGDCAWLGWNGGYPRTNIWIGTSVENQEQAEKRIPHLLNVEAPVKFLSCEPLLGPVKLWDYIEFDNRLDGIGIVHDYRWQPSTLDSPGESVGCSYPGISWVIVGGESGQKARPMQLAWARSLRDQCQAAGVSYFCKQLGGISDKRHNLEDMPEDLRIREFPQAVMACG